MFQKKNPLCEHNSHYDDNTIRPLFSENLYDVRVLENYLDLIKLNSDDPTIIAIKGFSDSRLWF